MLFYAILHDSFKYILFITIWYLTNILVSLFNLFKSEMLYILLT